MKSFALAAVFLLIWTPVVPAAVGDRAPDIATFSIVGFDPETEELGIAVASKFLAVGAVVPWARAGVGAVATQAFANVTYGERGLALLESGMDAQEVLDNLTGADEEKDRRQVGVVDRHGNSATFTGKECIPWAGGKVGKYYACQGNILVCEETVNAMAGAFEAAQGDLATRLVTALKAGEDAGGDARGRQSAALLVVKEAGGYGGGNDRYIDLRVDDHPEPIEELLRVLSIQQAYSALFKAGYLRQEGDLEGAAGEALRACEIRPDLPEALYDLACYYSLLGREEEALETLGRSLSIEPKFRDMARGDPDFEHIRGTAEFKAMLEE
jgi:uncharacterized Ntn-hydrolase superfamily protein